MSRAPGLRAEKARVGGCNWQVVEAACRKGRVAFTVECVPCLVCESARESGRACERAVVDGREREWRCESE